MKKGTILLILLLCGTTKGIWISPISTTDVDSPFAPVYWDNPDNSIDGDIATYAEEAEFTFFHRQLQFNFDFPYAEAQTIRIKAAEAYYDGGGVTEFDVEGVDIDFQLDGGNWFTFYDGFLAKDTWNIISPFTPYPISGLRIQSMNEDYKLRIYEVQVSVIPEPATILIFAVGFLLISKSRKIEK